MLSPLLLVTLILHFWDCSKQTIKSPPSGPWQMWKQKLASHLKIGVVFEPGCHPERVSWILAGQTETMLSLLHHWLIQGNDHLVCNLFTYSNLQQLIMISEYGLIILLALTVLWKLTKGYPVHQNKAVFCGNLPRITMFGKNKRHVLGKQMGSN